MGSDSETGGGEVSGGTQCSLLFSVTLTSTEHTNTKALLPARLPLGETAAPFTEFQEMPQCQQIFLVSPSLVESAANEKAFAVISANYRNGSEFKVIAVI